MKYNIPLKKIASTILLFVFGAALMTFANDRTPAPSPVPGSNIDQPIDVKALFNIKGVDTTTKVNGGLGVVGPFQANQNANIVGVASFFHSILGKSAASPDVLFGDSTKKVKVLAIGDIKAEANLQAWNLSQKNSEWALQADGGLPNVCTNKDGTLVLCGGVKDVCKNIDGIQKVFDKPPFKYKITNGVDTSEDKYSVGDCYGPNDPPPEDDLCFNVPGIQKTVPEGLIGIKNSLGMNICGRNTFFGKPVFLGEDKFYGDDSYTVSWLSTLAHIPPPLGGVPVHFYDNGIRMNFFEKNKQDIVFDWNYCFYMSTIRMGGDEGAEPTWTWQCMRGGTGQYGKEPSYDPNWNKDPGYDRFNVRIPAGSKGLSFKTFASNYPPVQWGAGSYWDLPFIQAGNKPGGSYGVVTVDPGVKYTIRDSVVFIHIQSDPEDFLKKMVAEPGSVNRVIIMQ